MDGRVLVEALDPRCVAERPVVVREVPYALPESAHQFSADEEARIQDMLEGLGYV
jgi:hypothetical protein